MTGPRDTSRFDALLVEEVRLACERARVLAGSEQGLPTREVPALERTPRGFKAATGTEVSWRLVAVMVHGEWDHMSEVTKQLADDPDVEADIGYTFDTPQRPVALWDDVIGPMVVRYGVQEPDLAWRPDLARAIVTDWRESHRAEWVPRRTIAPLQNLRSMLPEVRVRSGTVIRPMSNQDREDVWRHFGAAQIPGLTPPQLEAWTHVIDDRWELPVKPPIRLEVAFDRVSDVVTALRLHHPGVTGAPMLWTWVDPSDRFVPGLAGEATLFTADGMPTFADPLKTDIGPDDGPMLTKLVERLVAARSDGAVALALRRFDSAYGRRLREDALIDLWIAFEALLLPDGNHELSHRAALRIARLLGPTAAERKAAFKLAKQSYTARSSVVHGKTPKGDLDRIVRDTRQLARGALREWLLNPPSGGVDDLDDAMLA